MVEGTTPSDTSDTDIIVSKTVADQLQLHAGDLVLTYFIDEKVKVRNMRITGIFNTEFENYDNALILGNIKLIQQINGWNNDTGNFIGLNLKDTKSMPPLHDIHIHTAQPHCFMLHTLAKIICHFSHGLTCST